MSPPATATKVAVISLGCPKNLVDTEKMLGRFLEGGYEITPEPEGADLLLVNTCGFKADAEAESRQAIEEMAAIKAAHPGKRLVVTGCLSQRYGAALSREVPAIDILTGSAAYDRLIPIIESGPDPAISGLALPARNEPLLEDAPRVVTTGSHSAYLKIAEGCNNPCAFCIIPQLRGPFRSRSPEAIETEARVLAGVGALELNLVSQDTTLFGRDLQPRTDLATLLERLVTIDGIQWIRLLYLYPTLVTDRLLSVIARQEKILPYLDIPLQHSHSAILQGMKRSEREADVRDLLRRVAEKLPDAILRTTFIVGFPGEGEGEFQHLYDFVAEGFFDHVGVFTYSDEAGTTACELPGKVPASVAEARRDRLMALQQRISREKLTRLVGKTLPVIVDAVSEADEWVMEGRTVGMAPEADGLVYIVEGAPEPGQIVPVTITAAEEYDLVGRLAV